MNAKQALIEWLIQNGYNGLASEDCGCGIEDLAPCCESCLDCEPAHKVECNDCEHCCECSTRADLLGYAGSALGCWRTDEELGGE